MIAGRSPKNARSAAYRYGSNQYGVWGKDHVDGELSFFEEEQGERERIRVADESHELVNDALPQLRPSPRLPGRTAGRYDHHGDENSRVYRHQPRPFRDLGREPRDQQAHPQRVGGDNPIHGCPTRPHRPQQAHPMRLQIFAACISLLCVGTTVAPAPVSLPRTSKLTRCAHSNAMRRSPSNACSRSPAGVVPSFFSTPIRNPSGGGLSPICVAERCTWNRWRPSTRTAKRSK